MSDSDDEHGDSKLGKQEYWEETYEQELDNLKDHGDEGEIWFGEETLSTMVAWVDELLTARTAGKDVSILDLGTGNGLFLVKMAKLGYTNLTGTDYSKASIALAQAIAEQHGLKQIQWVVDDLLNSTLMSRHDVVADKGTLDAVGLSAGGEQKRLQYIEAVHKLLNPNGLLVITSCNSTNQELQEEFCHRPSPPLFAFVDMVKTYPVFRFGGFEGTKVSTVALKRC